MVARPHQRVGPVQRGLPDDPRFQARVERNLRGEAPDASADADLEALPRLIEDPEHAKQGTDRAGDPGMPALPKEVARVQVLRERGVEEVTDQREAALARLACDH